MSRPADNSKRSSNRGRYDEILSAFTRNVARVGYAGSNFSHIANELGISKGTIVHHYGTKDRLFAQMHDGYAARCLGHAQAIIARLPSPEEQLAGLLFSFLLYQELDRDATLAFQREIATLASHEALDNGRRLRDEYVSVVRQSWTTALRRASSDPSTSRFRRCSSSGPATGPGRGFVTVSA